MADTDSNPVTLEDLMKMAGQIQNMQAQPPPATPPINLQATEPQTFWGSLGERLAGGPPGDVPLTQDQREAAGRRSAMGFFRGLLNVGPFDSFGQGLGRGLDAAAANQIAAEQVAAARQDAAQEYAQQQFANRVTSIDAAVKLGNLQQQLARLRIMQQGLPGAGGGGTPGTTPGTSIAQTLLTAGADPYDAWIAGREGLAANPRSTAAGYGQFLASTWNDFAKANPDLFKGKSADEILAARNDPGMAAKAMAWLRGQNTTALTDANVPVTGQTLGISHYLGAGATSKLWGAPDTDPVSKYVSDAAVRGNPELGTMTVGDMKRRYAAAPNPGGAVQPGAPATTAPAASTAPPAAPYRIAGPAVAPPSDATVAPAAVPAGGVALPVPPQPPAAGPTSAQTQRPEVFQVSPTGQPMPETTLSRSLSPVALAAQLAGPIPQVITPAQQAQIDKIQPGGAAAPAPAPSSPTGQQPPTTRAPPATTPGMPPPEKADEDLSWEEYQLRHPITFSEDERKLFSTDLTPQQLANLEQQRKDAEAAVAAANQRYRMGDEKAGTDYNTALQKRDDILKAENDLIQQAQKQGGDALQKAIESKTAAQQKMYAQVIQPKLEAQRDINVAQGKSDIEQQVALTAQAVSARNRIDNLETMKGLSDQVGPATLLGDTQYRGQSLADIFRVYGIGTDEEMRRMGAIQAYGSAQANLAKEMRQGLSLGGQSDAELRWIQQMGPQLAQDPITRMAVTAYLENAQYQTIRLSERVNELMSGNGPDGKRMHYGQAVQQARNDIGSVVPKIDAGTWNATGPDGEQARKNWFASHVPLHTYYYDPSGNLNIYVTPEEKARLEKNR